jgi:hypothetical protein
MRNESLGNYSWDTSMSSINLGRGINQWGELGTYEGADLMRELNNDYLGNIIIGTDGYWYDESNDGKESLMPVSVLNEYAQSMIANVKWRLGANGSSNLSNLLTKNFYVDERSSNTGKICSDAIYCTDEISRTTDWIGKVGLMYPSDYGYSTMGGSNASKTECLNTALFQWSENSVSDCKYNSWIFSSTGSQKTITPFAIENYSTGAFSIDSRGNIRGDITSNSAFVRPTVFLDSDIGIYTGDGSESNPYKIAMY